MKKALALLVVVIIVCQGFAVLTPTIKALTPAGSVPEVVCVPFHGKWLGVPHDAWIGKEIVLKGTAHDPDDDGTLVSYRWDFGDGYTTGWIAGVNPDAIEAKHTYTGTMADGTTYGPGKYFTAWLSVKDGDGNVGEDSYFIAIRDVSDPKKKLGFEVNIAIDNGLWWLHKTQSRYSSGGIDYGRWYDSGYYIGPTSTAILAFEIHGHMPIGDKSEDPYVETVQRGLNYVFTQCFSRNINGPSSSCPYGDPDTNGNGIGIDVTGGRPVYEIGMVMMAIAASGDKSLVAATGPTNVIGRTYFDILTDMVDMCAWGQNEAGSGRGGWRYFWNYGTSDNSVTQWPIIGLEAAETNWGIKAPDFVKTELDRWLVYSQNPSGGFGYTAPWDWVNPAKTGAGLCGLAYIDLPPTDTRVTNAVNYLNSRWGTSGTDGYWGNYYSLYAIMKGCKLFDPGIEYIGARNWYWDDPGGFARYLVDQQWSDGRWPTGSWTSYILDTGWAILTLTPTITFGPPVASAGPDVDNHPPEPVSVKFDASGSYHTDPTRKIVLFEWDFDSDGTWDYSGTDVKVEYAYPAYKTDGVIDWDKTAKDYTATLRVTDDSDPALYDTDTRIVHITPPPWKPVADPDGPYEGYEGVPIQLDGSKSYDPESMMYAEGHPWYETIATYEWDLDNDGQFDDSTEINPSFTWETKGTYSVGLRVTDSQPSGPGGTTGPLDVDTKFATVVIKEATFNIAVIFAKFSDNDPAPSRSIVDFQKIKDDLIAYYDEASYGSISFGANFYPDDGSWLTLPHTRGYYGENTKHVWWIGALNKLFPDKNSQQFVEDVIDASDDIVDFTKYDYDVNNGRGIVLLVHPGYSEQHCKSTDDLKTGASMEESASGRYDTKDSTKVDAIILAEMDNLGGWAHEVGHVLGKLLVTSISGESKDGAWALPDRYKGGYMAGDGDIGDWGLMGSGSWLPSKTGTHPDHMSSFSKEWLGWLKYHEYSHPSYGTFWINSLTTMDLGDDIFQYKINENMYYLLEVRNKRDTYSDWDTTTPTPWLHDTAEVIYKVEKKSGKWIVNVASAIVLSPVPIAQSDRYSDDANKVMFKVVDENWGTKYEMKTEIKEPSFWNKLGAVLNPAASLLSLIPENIHGTPFQFEYPLPDLDLHAYSDDGNHIGMNYVTGEYEIQIPNATASGDLWNGQEWIFVPEETKVYFVVNAKNNAEFLDHFLEAEASTNGVDAYSFNIIYYDPNGLRCESTPVAQEIMPGEEIIHRYAIIPNPDGTYTPVIDDTPPLLTVEVPQENAALQDGVTLRASAWDENGVSSVTFSIREPNGEHGTIISPDFEYMPASLSTDDRWILPFDTTQLPDGHYLAYVEATDIAGNKAHNTTSFSIRNWACLELLPASESNKAGRTMPVKFSLRVVEAVDPAQPFVWNEELTIVIYEEGHPEDILQESTYGDTARDYRIDAISELYITNFRTLKKPTPYVVEICRKGMLIGSFTFETVK